MKSKKYRQGIFIVAYARTGKGIEYLILKRKLHWNGWEFPKGKIEKKETKEKTAKRETKEETGLKIIKIRKFNVSGKYLYHKRLPDRPGLIGQTFSLFSAEVKKGKIKLDKKEHNNYKWLDFKKAIKKLTWEDQRKCLKVVDNFLKNK
mgnify:CR=1 FL=1